MFLLGVVGVGVFAVQLRNFSMLGGGAALQTSFRAAGVFVVRDQFGSPSVQWNRYSVLLVVCFQRPLSFDPKHA